MARPEWQKAQDKVKAVLKAFEADKKDFWFQQPVDTYAARGEIVKEQPADFWFVFRGMFSLLEVKSSHYADKFYFKDVQKSQWAGVRRSEAAGGRSVFIIAKLPQWTWYIVDGMVFYRLKETGVPGIRWDDLQVLSSLDMTFVLTIMAMEGFRHD